MPKVSSSYPRGFTPLLPALLLFHASNLMGAEIGGDSGGKAQELKGGPRVPAPVVREASNEPAQALQKFALPDGFRMETWASEPLLSNPVAFCLDEKGRVFTSETNRYRTSTLDIRHYLFMLEDDLASRTCEDRIAYTKKNFPKQWQELEKETEVIRVIEDTDGDGKADKSAVFADGFNTMLDGIASGILAHKGSVWFTNMPNLWRLRDGGPNGAAATRESLSFGYGVRYSFTGHDMHGLIIGPDGRLYFTFGDRGAHVKTMEGETIALPDEGAVFRCELDGTKMELVHRGLRNPQELAFDNHGNLFTGDNDCDQGDRERWVYIVPGADSGWRVGWQHPPLGQKRNPWLVEKMWEPRAENTPAYLASPILNIPDGPSGVAFNPGTGLPESYTNAFFICGFKGTTARSAISWLRVREEGAGFSTEVEPQTFIGNVQATDVAFGPDSRVYLSEWGEGWEGTGRGRIFRGEFAETRKTQAKQIDEIQRLMREGFDKRPASELAELLAYPDQRIRLQAQWALASQPGNAGTLIKVARAATTDEAQALSRLHAIWGLGQMLRTGLADADAFAAIVALAGDTDAEVRAQACGVLGDSPAGKLIPRAGGRAVLIEHLNDPSVRVRYFAAQSLARFADANNVEAALNALKDNEWSDQNLRAACVNVLAAAGAEDPTLAKAASSGTLGQRLGVLLAYRKLRSPRLAGFLAASESQLVEEAARAINDEGITECYKALAAHLGKTTGSSSFTYRVLNAAFRAGETHALVGFAASSQPAEFREEALRLLSVWAKPMARDFVAGVYRPLNARPAAEASDALRSAITDLVKDKAKPVVMAALTAVAELRMTGAAGAVASVLADEKTSEAVAVAALQTLATIEAPKLDEAIGTALTSKHSQVRIAATGLLAKRDPDAAVVQLMAAYNASPDAVNRRFIITTLGTVKSAKVDDEIAKLLAGTKTGSVPASALLELLDIAAARKTPVVQAALAAYEKNLLATDPLAAFEWALEGGDTAAGEKAFKEHPAGQCLRCHKVAGAGGEAGPDLSKIAATKDRRYLLHSVIDPNAAIAEGFQTIMVTTKDGGIQAGIVKAETDAELTLLMPIPGAQPVKVKKADIKLRENAPSGMPPGLGLVMSRREVRDVVQYLSTLR